MTGSRKWYGASVAVGIIVSTLGFVCHCGFGCMMPSQCVSPSAEEFKRALIRRNLLESNKLADVLLARALGHAQSEFDSAGLQHFVPVVFEFERYRTIFAHVAVEEHIAGDPLHEVGTFCVRRSLVRDCFVVRCSTAW